MPLFNQRTGLMAQGTINQQAQPQRKKYGLMGLPEFAGVNPTVSTAPQASQPQEQMPWGRKGPIVGGSPYIDYKDYAETQPPISPEQEKINAINAESNVAKVAGQQDTITSGYRLGLKSPYDIAVNPYDSAYQQNARQAAAGDVAAQFGAAREGLRAQLSARGINPDSGLFQSMIARGAMDEARARANASTQSDQATAQNRANFEQWRAQGNAGWQQNLQQTANILAKQPTELDILKAQADQLKADARVSTETANDKIAISNIQRRIQENPDVINAMVDEMVSKGAIAETEKESAALALANAKNEMDPRIRTALKVTAMLGGTAIGAFFGGPAGAWAGFKVGSMLSESLDGQDVYAMNQVVKDYIPGANQTTPVPNAQPTGALSPQTSRPPGMLVYTAPTNSIPAPAIKNNVLPRVPRRP